MVDFPASHVWLPEGNLIIVGYSKWFVCESKIYDIGLPFIADNHNILQLLSEVFFPNISWGGISVFFMA
jgi:hypothetical protein